MRLEDLLEIGLKPYDLVWIPGKSAAWRYPSEIEELKPYTTAVEEQPFDRFYKKDADEKTWDEPVTVPEKNTYKQEVITPKYITVTLPAGTGTVNKTRTVKAKPEQTVPAYDEYKAYMPAAKTSDEKVVVKTVTPKTVHEQLLVADKTNKEEEKIAGFTEKYEQRYNLRKEKWNKRTLLIKYGRMAALVVVVLGIGVIFAFNIGKPDTNPNLLATNSTAATLPDAPPAPVTEESSAAPVTENETAVQTSPPYTPPPPAATPVPLKFKDKIPENLNTAIANNDKIADMPADKKSLDLSRKSTAKAVLDKQPAASVTDTKEAYAYETYTTDNKGERSRNRRDNETVKTGNNNSADNNNNGTVKNNSNPFYAGPAEKTTVSTASHADVKVIANEYKVVPFGGIRNLQLTVQNRSGEALETVVVDVEYKKRDGGVFKTKTVEFKNIAPKSSAVLKVDDTNRGVDVAYHIRKVVK